MPANVIPHPCKFFMCLLLAAVLSWLCIAWSVLVMIQWVPFCGAQGILSCSNGFKYQWIFHLVQGNMWLLGGEYV